MNSHSHNPTQNVSHEVSFLHQMPTDQPTLFGGKATNLARLYQVGILIPRGFVIPIFGFTSFITQCKKHESYGKMRKHQDDVETLLQLVDTFHKSASQCEVPQTVRNGIIKGFNKLETEFKGGSTGYAVRSSATAEDTEQFSFAGQADSFLCVRDPPRVIEAVKQTWLSLYSPRAILYLNSKGLDFDKIHMSVIIQEMILGDVSGVMFTANVVNQNPNELIIDSTWGLGESIVSGKVKPDSFVLQKTPLEILQRRLGEKALYSVPYPLTKPECTIFKETPTKKREAFSLTNDKLHELAKIGLQIERKMGSPQDIEWTYKNGKFTILQTRPITTL